jgi:sigma-B regulation protein RsbU (phosphoserine phosphatase)
MTEKRLDLDYKQLFDDAPCGYVLVSADGVVIRANNWVSTLLGYETGGVDGKHLREIFSMAGRILYETNLAPLLRLRETISEVTLDLKRRDGTAIPVIMGACSSSDASGLPYITRIVFVQAGERRLYERELVNARDDAQQGLRLQQADGELREQFIAVLGHDLRNPLASVSAATRILAKEALSDRGRQVIGLMQGSVVRMSGLIDNVLDFARARLGGGIGLDLQQQETLETLIDQVVQELRSSSPEHQVRTSYAITHSVVCDASKIGQLVSNLLGNALTHGDSRQPIRLHAETTVEGGFRLWVANGGSSISRDMMPRLFDPFVRGQSHGYKEGLGLGLFIAHEIAKAHGGTLNVTSSDDETRFMFEMPPLEPDDLRSSRTEI